MRRPAPLPPRERGRSFSRLRRRWPRACAAGCGEGIGTGFPPLLVVNNIEVIYSPVILVLKGVSLAVPKGGIVALLGANGAGKTTTLKAISNLLRAERGEVTKGAIPFEGERVDRLSPNELVRRGCIQVMEGRHCFGHLTVEENLLTGAFTRRDGREAIARDLEAIYGYFPRLRQRRHAHGRLHLRRRAADVRDRPRDDVATGDDPARRAFDGAGAADGRGDFRDRRGPQREGGRLVPAGRAERQYRAALRDFGYILENGRVVLDGAAEALRANEDVKEFYLGVAGAEPPLVPDRQALQAAQTMARLTIGERSR